MTLEELKQIKNSLSQGVMIHKGKWLEVLDAAIMSAENEQRIRKNMGMSNVYPWYVKMLARLK